MSSETETTKDKEVRVGTFIYSSTFLYGVLMRLLHGRYYSGRYTVIASEVREGEAVVELCCGDCRLYLNYLSPMRVTYIGLDGSPAFIRAARQRGVDCRLFDARFDAVPEADVVIMQASLHLFPREMDSIMERMLAAARRCVIVSEPVRNLASSGNAAIKFIAKTLTRVSNDGAGTGFRFNQRTLEEFFRKWPEFERFGFCPGGREMIGLFRGRNRSTSSHR